MRNNYLTVLDYNIYSGDISTLSLNKRTVVNTLNGHSYAVAKKDVEFKNALLQSQILLPDGEPVVFGSKLLCGEKINKISGYECFTAIMEKLNRQGGSCFFLGSNNHTLNLIKERVSREYPLINMDYFSPPYATEFNAEENRIMVERINAYDPDVLFVGMTAPKQEKWVHSNKDKLKVNVLCSIGAVFDFYAGTVKRAPGWMVKCKLEWFHRFLKQPFRLAHRYFVSTPQIFIDIYMQKRKLNKEKHNPIIDTHKVYQN
ncbi:WecB/TagA/CpsF family glycosyltransferase [Saccharicrinis aurantiacus]|uniref:WecB/TagA/CpsF family glycosyltransferase n=1 Tax=Saccharicrinis aurantiacus TaxID=1849719 RepID=UPI0008393E61|nr:WecB/TagA/CpsF family glycosyltransferase [Saccharicrinis aurantiacus]